ncbi:aminotransferase class I/II-fold pyridoxal phosphate-dependent enzyme [Paenibacillus puldeungensis]|uniref:Aminotransferase class I/II-fold pyridoxal phosphate-dependent enzyme n=1 Tax=Paenibacillus puldeungensis TaxID=696536 RepID=A0ABW3S6K7_9BACL
MDQAPLAEALLKYKEKQDASFHVPGHKDGRAFQNVKDREAYEALSEVMKIDATEITGTDDLHHPEGVILEAQQQAARVFGAEETFFLVGGSTAGNLALILSVCTSPGDVLLVQRNVHKSVIHGLMLAHAHAVFLAPQLGAGSGLATIPSEATVREALRRYPGAKGLLLTHPSYYGMGAALRPLAELCHEHGVPLLVDEAHGAHFGRHPALPESALAAGADSVVQSTHKMLTALTMGAMLHVQGGLLDRGLLRGRLTMVQSSSPSYPIMASLDLSRRLLETEGPALFAAPLAAAERIKQGLSEMPRYGIVQLPGACGADPAYTIQDPLKIVLYDAKGDLSGYELQRKLEQQGCIPEMSDDRYVVLALGPGTSLEEAERLLQALERIADGIGEAVSVRENGPTPFSTWNIRETMSISNDSLASVDALPSAISAPVPFGLTPLSPAEIETIPVEDSVGRQAAEMIIPYPPGIPLVYAGEMITEDTKDRLIGLKLSKAKCQGAADPLLRAIQVMKTKRKAGNDADER